MATPRKLSNIIYDSYSSQTCSNCGEKKSSLSLSQRVFQCDDCDIEVTILEPIPQESIAVTISTGIPM
ncbi:zinc ribbon domain-containing protein [Anabaena lutea]|uniref:Transposase n=1 Tax=Anabaena lutea FACHB-196 TaxID=2692881 RepID=A0ABR8FLA0_9NOST|nr:zinc ribbon domain-containing protein [Anabaena lutea]MBD2570972.1 transposase [Anabaena lutea FACHB-196]